MISLEIGSRTYDEEYKQRFAAEYRFHPCRASYAMAACYWVRLVALKSLYSILEDADLICVCWRDVKCIYLIVASYYI